MKDLKKLSEQATAATAKKYSSVPAYGIPKTKFSDSTANGLTTAIIHFLKLKGHYCGRTNTTGTYSQKLGRYIHSGSTRGQSDLNAIVNGQSWQIEIKFGKDELSTFQKKIRDQVTSAGGVYLVVRTFAEFISDYKNLTDKHKQL